MTKSIEPVSPLLRRRSLARKVFAAVIGVLATGGVVARGVVVAQGHAQSADPRDGISGLYTALQSTMRMGPATPFQQRFDTIAPVVDRVFDLDTILRTSVGLRWSALDEPAQKTLFSVFRTFTIASYTANFNKENGEKFDILPETRASGADRIVMSTLTPKDGDRIRIDYLMRNTPDGWRVADVLLDGTISRVAVQRSDFRSLLAQGDPGPLIDSLRKKIVDLSGGAMRA